ncbi:MAG: cyclic nucleotide-binding domain-containing protein [Bacteroidetes bacterium]|nr:cyclic nucleotide-binding domain-containing protein [Bacteroidota bacterium]
MESTEHKLLKEYIGKLHPLKEEELDALCSNWQTLSAKRKTVLTTAGETERYLYFVTEGVQRAFYIDEQNREATIVFTYPPSFSGVADSFLTQTPSLYFLETLTASQFLRISYEEIKELMNKYPAIQSLFLHAAAGALKGTLFRQVELQCYTSEEKFRTLMQRSPHLLNLVPHKYIASYLGIDATNFSKLVNTVKI